MVIAASPVITDTKNGTAYLEIHSYGSMVRVQRTAAGRTLNRFWAEWLRYLILQKTDTKQGFAVEIRGSRVLVSSNTTHDGLTETVRAFCQQIKPLPHPPIRRRDNITSNREAHWWVDEGSDLTNCVKQLRLPGRARVMGGEWLLTLSRDPKNIFRMSELCMMVELHVALHCRS